MFFPDFEVKGNNGGDVFKVTSLGDGMLRLKVGHCCVYTIDSIVPVEFLTAALTEIVTAFGGPKEFVEQAGWDDEYTKRLLDKINSRG